ncbi:hypothetical protein ILYODFUR_025079 [Ilyodon furcidens]|uniref:Uncharacterized protein n=1 Tax=Ilyodon furcidens TaxID=33524 RepID=A0ABV0UWU8_9TELE
MSTHLFWFVFGVKDLIFTVFNLLLNSEILEVLLKMKMSPQRVKCSSGVFRRARGVDDLKAFTQSCMLLRYPHSFWPIWETRRANKFALGSPYSEKQQCCNPTPIKSIILQKQVKGKKE